MIPKWKDRLSTIHFQALCFRECILWFFSSVSVPTSKPQGRVLHAYAARAFLGGPWDFCWKRRSSETRFSLPQIKKAVLGRNPRKRTNFGMTMENPPWMKMHFLLKMGFVECLVGFRDHQSGGKWLGSPPLICHEWPFGRGTARSLGDENQPWLLTTYKSWDDPPSTPLKFTGLCLIMSKWEARWGGLYWMVSKWAARCRVVRTKQINMDTQNQEFLRELPFQNYGPCHDSLSQLWWDQLISKPSNRNVEHHDGFKWY